ncbi:hypothetical protein RLDS_25205 [Sphingobium lactosutens DS20]|jgi:hypothetical protein|uniref:Uncharacterized protein n=1 Tax=Sphingobium lactosutens DS20 TaxID=1331060 RepID=T0IGC3_9SPHN|nr:hypothetical protein RLDS_25205 [Sphingobium lactosutens DS20]
MIDDANEEGGKPVPGGDIVERTAPDEREHDDCALAAAIGAAEELCLRAERHSAERSLRGIVHQTDSTVDEEGDEGKEACAVEAWR